MKEIYGGEMRLYLNDMLRKHSASIDSLAAQYVESPGAGEKLRALTMSVFAEDVILKDRKQRVGKYVILTGQKHSHTHSGGASVVAAVTAIRGLATVVDSG